MKHETKHGLGEVVIVRGATDNRHTGTDLSDRYPDDEIGKVTAIHLQLGQLPMYTVRYCDRAGRQTVETLPGAMLIGDPMFDQERGCYPEENGDE